MTTYLDSDHDQDEKMATSLKAGRNQCDQIGRFLKVFGEIFFAKVAQIYIDLLGYFKNIPFK